MTDKPPPHGLQESDELLSELLEEVQRWEGTLAGGIKLGPGAAAVTNLKDSKVSLGSPKDKLTLHRYVRIYAAAALGKIGNAEAVNALIAALDDSDRYVRIYAAEALG